MKNLVIHNYFPKRGRVVKRRAGTRDMQKRDWEGVLRYIGEEMQEKEHSSDAVLHVSGTQHIPARQLTRAEIKAELALAPKSNSFGFPGGKVRYDALKQALAEKEARGEDAAAESILEWLRRTMGMDVKDGKVVDLMRRVRDAGSIRQTEYKGFMIAESTNGAFNVWDPVSMEQLGRPQASVSAARALIDKEDLRRVNRPGRMGDSLGRARMTGKLCSCGCGGHGDCQH